MSDSKQILIIDDSRVSRMKLRQLLLQKHPQWQIVEAGSGEEGVQVAETAAPDLVTIDVNMPGIDGFATVSRIQALRPQAKIVLLSGNIQEASRRKAEELGVGFVEKPITAAAVEKVLAHLAG
jgi:two-component system chemotaxis response regulator CheY